MPKQEGYVQIPVKELYHMALSSLIKASVPESEAKIISESLVEADQRGVYTHGCVCLQSYIGLIRTGSMRPKADYYTISKTDVI